MDRSTFITNAGERKLADRLRVLVGHSQELKFLVGFFYFSGYQALYEALKEAVEKDPELRLKVLVGLSADTSLGRLLEVAGSSEGTIGERIEAFLQDLRRALSHKELDHPSFPEQARFFLRLLEEGRLEIRKTHEPVHAKLYLFRFKQHGQELIPQGGSFITGSSNLTQAGLEGQLEFNVEILQYGFPEAERFFDDLWKKATPLSPEDIQRVAEVVRRESLAAEPSPLEVYALVLRRYLDVLDGRPGREGPADLLEKAGFTPYRYQLDAVEMLLSALETHGGAILADVVGLGKTVVAALAGRELGRRGIVIAPPHLIGEEGSYGWKDYLEKLGLYDWRVFSTGELDKAKDFVEKRGRDVELVVVDEAHRFRNPETKDYAHLSAITRGRKVLLLTATPINNRPRDAYALLQLFVPPGASSLGPERRLDTLFRELDRRFQLASYALRYLESKERDKRKRAERYYKELVNKEPRNPKEMKQDLERVLEEVAGRTRRVLEPVTVRRNRKDLQEDPRYRQEAPPFPKVHDPEPLFYELTQEQNEFYDWLLTTFGPDGGFRGAAYQPVAYFPKFMGKDPEDESLSGEESFALESQKNLASFMRRLLVRRLESSFGAFAETLGRLAALHEKLLRFAQSTGYYLLNRDLLEKLLEQMEEGLFDDEEALLSELDSLIEEEEKAILRGERKRKRIYSKEDFGAGWGLFLEHLESDLGILTQAMTRAAHLHIADPQVDPKAQRLKEFLKEALKDPRRKVVVFSEFTDTIAHLKRALEGSEIPFIAVGKEYSRRLLEEVVRNFDPKANPRADEYRVLLASDRLSEGVNLHRADTVVNYDIPWNPTRLIQRLGRVNRVGGEHKEVHLYHFFPTARGKEVVDPSSVAANKLFLIHKALGEDSKILSPSEEPTPSGIYARLLQLPEEQEPLSLETWARKEWEALIQAHPDLEKAVRRLPNRVKTGMAGERDLALVVARKGLAFFARVAEKGREKEPQDLFLDEVFGLLAKAKEGRERLEPSEWFHQAYQKLSEDLEKDRRATPSFASGSLEQRALNNLNTARSMYKDRLTEEELRFIDALERELKYRGGLPRYVVRLLQRADLGNEKALPAFREDLKEAMRLFPEAGKDLEGTAPQVDLLVGVEIRKGEG